MPPSLRSRGVFIVGFPPTREMDGGFSLAVITVLLIDVCPESTMRSACAFLKKNQNAPRPSEHPPVRGKKCQNV